MKIKLQWDTQWHITMIILNIGEDVEQKVFSFIASGNIKWFMHFGNSLAVTHKIQHMLSLWPSAYIRSEMYFGKWIEKLGLQKTIYENTHRVLLKIAKY